MCSSDFSRAKPGGAVNDDACLRLDDAGLYVIADGMGGYEHGNEASRIVVQTLQSIVMEKKPEEVLPDWADMPEPERWKSFLTYAVKQANVQLCRMAADRRAEMGSTVTAVLIRGRHLYCAHVGDCRLYLFEGDALTPELLTRDHRGSGIQSNRLERSLGKDLNVSCDTHDVPLPARFAILLCCDGLWSFVQDARLAEIAGCRHYADVAEALVRHAAENENSDDDVTAVYAESPDMREWKRARDIERKEAALDGGDNNRQYFEEALGYRLERKDLPLLQKRFPQYVRAFGGSPELNLPLVESVLDTFQAQDEYFYIQMLAKLFKRSYDLKTRLEQLVRDCLRRQDQGDVAVQAYKVFLQKHPHDAEVSGALAIALLTREGMSAPSKKEARPLLEIALKNPALNYQDKLRLLSEKYSDDGRGFMIDLFVTARLPGVTPILKQFLNREDTRPWAESLLHSIADNYPPQLEDKGQAQDILRQIHDKSECARLERKLADSEQQCDKLRSEKERIEQERSRLEAALQGTKQTLLDYKAQYERARQELSEARKLLENKQIEKDALESKKDNYLNRIEELERKLAQAARQLDRHRGRRDYFDWREAMRQGLQKAVALIIALVILALAIWATAKWMQNHPIQTETKGAQTEYAPKPIEVPAASPPPQEDVVTPGVSSQMTTGEGEQEGSITPLENKPPAATPPAATPAAATPAPSQAAGADDESKRDKATGTRGRTKPK